MHVKLNSAEFSVLNKLATTSAVNSAKKLCISLDIVGSSKIAKCRSDEEKHTGVRQEPKSRTSHDACLEASLSYLALSTSYL